jgi:hypothetical protein
MPIENDIGDEVIVFVGPQRTQYRGFVTDKKYKKKQGFRDCAIYQIDKVAGWHYQGVTCDAKLNDFLKKNNKRIAEERKNK